MAEEEASEVEWGQFDRKVINGSAFGLARFNALGSYDQSLGRHK